MGENQRFDHAKQNIDYLLRRWKIATFVPDLIDIEGINNIIGSTVNLAFDGSNSVNIDYNEYICTICNKQLILEYKWIYYFQLHTEYLTILIITYSCIKISSHSFSIYVWSRFITLNPSSDCANIKFSSLVHKMQYYYKIANMRND